MQHVTHSCIKWYNLPNFILLYVDLHSYTTYHMHRLHIQIHYHKTLFLSMDFSEIVQSKSKTYKWLKEIHCFWEMKRKIYLTTTSKCLV